MLGGKALTTVTITMPMDPVFLALIMTTMRRKKSASFSLMSNSQDAGPSNRSEQSGGVRRRNTKEAARIKLTKK